MPLIRDGQELRLAQAIARLTYCNPFLTERIEIEREALGSAFVEEPAAWNVRGAFDEPRPNVARIGERCDELLTTWHGRLREGAKPSQRDQALYEDAALFALYHRYRGRLLSLYDDGLSGGAGRPRVGFYAEFVREFDALTDGPGFAGSLPGQAAHIFACFFQIVRAFRQIFAGILGVSRPAAQFRAAVWQSLFTHDMRRYRRVLYDRMADAATLITGPTGTGKELAARAIGLARYFPFDPASRTFAEGFTGSFFALNLSALSPTLIESELFGHRRGAFTGALEDRAGWLEVCPALGTVFLDEIGELAAAIQVKLLRVAQYRTFQRIGDTKTREFHGKIIAATNRDLAEELRAGRFRADFYYRLCADQIVAPTLREQLADCPAELPNLVRVIARRLVGDEADELAPDAEQFIEKRLGRNYAWPGNFRELEQCVRNVMIRGTYAPPRAPAIEDDWLAAAARGALTADELVKAYCRRMYAETPNFVAVARRLGVDRRTVKAWVTG